MRVKYYPPLWLYNLEGFEFWGVINGREVLCVVRKGEQGHYCTVKDSGERVRVPHWRHV
jgi:hypothetical protein